MSLSRTLAWSSCEHPLCSDFILGDLLIPSLTKNMTLVLTDDKKG